MSRHDQVPDDQLAMVAGPKEIFSNHTRVVRDPRQTLCASVVAKLVIRQPDIKKPIEQRAGLRRTMSVGFPNEFRPIRQSGDEFQH